MDVIQDRYARDRIAGPPGLVELDRNFIVLAGAGAGKTTALVGRMIALVRHGVEVDTIAAITFTRKAAGEMKARFFTDLQNHRTALQDDIAEAIEQGRDPAPLRTELGYVERALDRIEFCFIDTIHAFCGRLLRERPVEAGLMPGFNQIEDRDEKKLRREFWLTRYLPKKLKEEPHWLDLFAEYGVDVTELYDFFGNLCEFTDLPVLSQPVDRPYIENAVRDAIEKLNEWQAKRPDPLINGRDEVMKLLDKADLHLRYVGVESDRSRIDFLRLFAAMVEGDGTAKKFKITKWTNAKRSSDDYKDLITLRDDGIPTFVKEKIAPVIEQWSACAYEHILAFTRPAVEAYAEHRKRLGLLTFQDLLDLAAKLLAENPDVRRDFQSRYRYLLVDEFQDTDPVQAKVLFYLTGRDSTHEKEWYRCVPSPGSLFIVGDDKQSIYRFRRADVQVFDQVRRLIVETGGEELRLTTNFRSLGRVCSWCNRAVEPLFEEPSAPYQAAWEPLRPFRPEGLDGFAVRKITIGDVKGNKAAEIAAIEAGRIAAFVRAACDGRADTLTGPVEDAPVFDGPARYSDFLILTRLSKRLPIYASALEKLGIPYSISGGGALGDSEELKALIELLRCVREPMNPVHLVAYLRGLYVGLGDDALYRFVRASGSFDERWQTPSTLPENDRERFELAFGHLRRAAWLLENGTPSAAIEQLVDEMGMIASAARREPGSSRAGNLLKTLAIVRKYEADGLHWTEILDELQLLLDDEVASEELTLETGGEDVVRLMTVHQAKGLQARVVFLADPYDPRHHPTLDFHVSREEEFSRIVLPARRKGRNNQTTIAEPLGWKSHFAVEEEKFRLAEERRLRYVAATRAENLLVVSRYLKDGGKGFWSDFASALDAVPELEDFSAPDGKALSVERDWDALRLEGIRHRENVARASYGLARVTDEQKVDPDLHENTFRVLEPGYGAGYGTAVHRLLEWCIRYRHKDVRTEAGAYVRELLQSEISPDEDLVEKALRAAEQFRGYIDDELNRADEVYTEVPFGFPETVPWTDKDNATREVPGVTHGTIDLIYRTDGEWKIVDYKTNKISREKDLRDHVSFYRGQITRYAAYWEAITGEKVTEAGLWFTDTGSYVAVELPEDQPAEASHT